MSKPGKESGRKRNQHLQLWVRYFKVLCFEKEDVLHVT